MLMQQVGCLIEIIGASFIPAACVHRPLEPGRSTTRRASIQMSSFDM